MARPMSLMIEGWMPSVGSSIKQELRPRHHGPADGELLLLAAREIAAAPAQHLGQHREQLEHRVGDAPLAARQQREAGLEVLAHRQEREDLAALRHGGDAEPRARVRAQAGDILALPQTLPPLMPCRPEIARSSEVLPTPLRPSTQVTCPGSAVSETSRSACAAP